MESARILRDATKLFGSQLAVGAVAIVFSAWLVRALSKEELALYPVLGLCVGFVMAVSGFGMGMSQQRLIPERMASGREEEARGVARACLRLSVGGAAVMAGAAMVLAPQLSRWLLKTPEMAGMLRALGPAIFLGAVSGQLHIVLQSTDRFGRLSLNQLLVGTLGVVLAVPCYRLLGRPGLVVAMTSAPLVAVVVALAPLREFLFTAPARRVEMRELLRFSLPFYGTSVITFVNTNADSLLLAALTSPEHLATYYVAYKFVGYLFHFANSGFRVLMIKLGKLKVEGMDRVAGSFTRASRYVFLFIAPVAGALAAVSPMTIRLYAGHRYGAAAPVLAVLCLYMFVFMLYGLHRFYLFNLAAPRATFELQLVTTCLTLGITAAAVVRWGGMGAAAGQAAALGMAAGVGRVMLGRQVAVRYDLGGLRIALAALAPSAALVLAAQLLSGRLAVELAAAGAALLVFAFIFMRLISARDAELLRHYLPRPAWRALLAVSLLRADWGAAAEAPASPSLGATPAYPGGGSG